MIRLGPITGIHATSEATIGRAQAVPPWDSEDLDARLPQPNSLRRASTASKVAGLAAREALEAGGVPVSSRVGVYVGQQQIPLDYCREFIDTSYRHGPRLASPMLFSESVANNAATHLSLTLKMTGPLQTFIGTRAAGIQAVMAAAEDLQAGMIEAGLVVVLSFAHELTSEAYNSLTFPHARVRRPPPILFATGAKAFLVRPSQAPFALKYAGVRCFGRDLEAQVRAVRSLWEDYVSEHPRPSTVHASTFCLARARSLETLRRAIGVTPSEELAEGLARREAFALDPFLRLLTPVFQGTRAVVCLGEEGTAGLLAVEGSGATA